MLINRRVLVFFVAVALFLFVASPPLVLAQTDTAGAIASAKEEIVVCYQAARDAEAAGANITSLTAVLNDAGALLSSAEFAYAASDFGGASDFAVQSVARLDGFVSAANALKETAQQQRSFDFWVYFVGSVVGTFAVLGGSYALWVFLSRRYGGVGARAGESSGV
jgi:hypothetical protein